MDGSLKHLTYLVVDSLHFALAAELLVKGIWHMVTITVKVHLYW